MILAIGNTTINTKNVAYIDKIDTDSMYTYYLKVTFHSGAHKTISFSSEYERNKAFQLLSYAVNQ